MTGRGLLLVGALAWVGSSLLFAEVRSFGRVPLRHRVGRYVVGPPSDRPRPGALSVASLRDVLAPLARSAGDRASRAVGVTEDLAVRLERVHSSESVTAFRMRELGLTVLAMLTGAAVAAVSAAPPLLVLLFVLGTPVLTFLVVEQRVASASASWQRRLADELPTVAEQLGMLLGAGYSLGGALNRLAGRGSGVAARDLTRVCGRMRHGIGVDRALHEWGAVARLEPLDRLVAVLALDRHAHDLGHLITEEARAMRRSRHRRLLEIIDRRSQQVWIPVTVAALVPGVLLIAVPFVQAMRLFTSG
jgi:Flp pilus assembly protein TadB